jgi:hypothetical protein
MALPPVYPEVFWLFFLAPSSTILLDLLLRAIVASGGSLRELKRRLREAELPRQYSWCLIGLFILTLVIGAPLPVAVSVRRGMAFALMGLFTVAPLWGLRGLPRYFVCAQELALMLWAYMKPDIAVSPSRVWFLPTLVIGYTVLFVGATLVRRHQARHTPTKARQIREEP